ncbi:hypothetical protein H6G59_18575 [Anabaena lutea FACHB-196]|uniref:Uncharacterized protein n=1 Tax=Anabaena lutea FACHB-196 TaxID=2692881 RepID=A0ABR8FJC2_9NOST|nr:hypothetical protein [Anabaena lutea FACHB-196]
MLHRIRKKNGEILHPVYIDGLRFSGAEWVYAVNLPEDHPDWILEDSEWAEVEEEDLEEM